MYIYHALINALSAARTTHARTHARTHTHTHRDRESCNKMFHRKVSVAIIMSHRIFFTVKHSHVKLSQEMHPHYK